MPEVESAVKPVVDREKHGEIESDPHRYFQAPFTSHTPKDEVDETGDGHQYHNIEQQHEPSGVLLIVGG